MMLVENGRYINSGKLKTINSAIQAHLIIFYRPNTTNELHKNIIVDRPQASNREITGFLLHESYSKYPLYLSTTVSNRKIRDT